MLGRVAYGEELVGTTEAVAARKVIARRRTEFRTSAGELAARLIVDWALTSADGAPTRIPPIFAAVFTMPEQTFAPIRVRAIAGRRDRRPAALELEVRPQELDPMGHVNNAVYLDWAEEAMRAAGGADGAAAIDAVPRRWRLEYLGAAAARARVRAIAWPAGGRLVVPDRRRRNRRAVPRGPPGGLTRTGAPAAVPGVGPGRPGASCHRATAPDPTGPHRTRTTVLPAGRDVRPRTAPDRGRYHPVTPEGGDHRAMAASGGAPRRLPRVRSNPRPGPRVASTFVHLVGVSGAR